MSQSANPKVSVIIPTYNRADLLPRAVNSVLAQTYQDYEILIVDDCSSDDTQQAIAAFDDPRIRPFRHDRNRRAAAARNMGIAEARGEYIAFLDDDDEWLPTKLGGQVVLLDSSLANVGLVYGWMDRMEDSTGRLIPSYRNTIEGDIFEDSLALNIPGGTIVLLVRSTVAREVGGFEESLTRFDDADFICRVTQRYDVAVLPEVVAKAHFDHEHEQMGENTPKYLADAANFLRKHIDRYENELNKRPRTLATLLRRLAGIEMMRGNRRESLSALASALRLDPLGVSQAILKNHKFAVKLFSLLVCNPALSIARPRKSDQR